MSKKLKKLRVVEKRALRSGDYNTYHLEQWKGLLGWMTIDYVIERKLSDALAVFKKNKAWIKQEKRTYYYSKEELL